MPITIKDVAKLADASISTVSKVLNGKDVRVSKEKRREIVAAADQLNYIPNPSAVRLKTGRTHAVAVLVPDLLNPFFPKFVRQLVHRLGDLQYDAVIYDTNHSLRSEVNYLQSLQSRAVDGAIVALSGRTRSRTGNQTVMDTLEQLSLPVVFFNKELPAGKFSSVSTDLAASGALAAEHLTALGHCNIGYISESLHTKQYSLRYKGFFRALAQAGIRHDPALVVESGLGHQGSVSAGREILKKKVTAVFCETDQMAIGILATAREAGIRVPEELSVVGMDDMFMGRIAQVPLTTVRQSVVDLSQNIVQILIREIETGQRRQITRRLTPELRIRQSTGPARA